MKYIAGRDSKKRLNSSGFTIIEVMIVLVIAAVILLIVFLAIPALQRNSRNTQRKDDAARIVAAFNEYLTNNPTTTPHNTSEFVTNVVSQAGNLAYYTDSDFNYSTTAYGVVSTSKYTNNKYQIHVRQGFTCQPDPNVSTTAWLQGTGSQFIVVVWLENSSGPNVPFCVEG